MRGVPARPCSSLADWNRLRGALGDPEWAASERFATVERRLASQDEIEGPLGAWTRERTAEQVMTELQSAGVESVLVANNEDLHRDPQLAHRRHFRSLDHGVIGRHVVEANAMRFSETPEEIGRPAPLLGEHTEHVFRGLLGMSDDEFRRRTREAVTEFARVLKPVLTATGAIVFTAEDAGEAIRIAKESTPNIVLLDLGLPDIDGVEICRRLRSEEIWVPILMLTGRAAIEDRVAGLDDPGEPVDQATLLKRSGLTPAELSDLDDAGLVQPVSGTTVYPPEAVLIATEARRLIDQGFEPRHLRSVKLAADRESDLITQLAAPLLRAVNPDARNRARELLEECSDSIRVIHRALLTLELRRQLS